MATRLAFIGLGPIGQGITKNLVANGNLGRPLTLYNRTRFKAEEHASKIGHSIVAESLGQVVESSDTIWTCLQDWSAVRQTYEEILKKDIKGKLIVDSSTILPESTKLLDKWILDAGAEFVALPVFGETTLAATGRLVCIAGGAATSVERIKPYLEGVIAQKVIDLSGQPSSNAALLKVVGNVLIMTSIETTAELSVFSEKTGLRSESMQSLLQALLPGSPHLIYWERMSSGNYYKAEPIVENHKAKALSKHILGLAETSGASLKSYRVAIENLAEAEAHAGPANDVTGIYGAVRVQSGMAFQNGD